MAETTGRDQAGPSETGPAEIGLLLFPGAQAAAIHGLTDLFRVANLVATGEDESRPSPLRISHWEAADGAAPIRVFDTAPEAVGAPVAIVAPPSLGASPTPELSAALAPWLTARHAAGATLASVCAGAFVIAGTGLLDGRTATTHWALEDEFRTRFPRVDLAIDKLIVDDGDILTAGGLMAWTDLGLRLVDRLLGPELMIETARYLLIDPPGREQRYYSPFAPRLDHRDAAILKAQHWLQANGARGATLAAMAACAGLEERTFLRRFHKATGLKPTDYCQRLRIGRARSLLEAGGNTIEQIAWTVGYEDAGAFRKVFQRITGLTPGDYRRRFAPHAAP